AAGRPDLDGHGRGRPRPGRRRGGRRGHRLRPRPPRRADHRRLGRLGGHPRARGRHRPRGEGAVTRIRVAVIGGGQNSEHEVSLASAAAVAEALDPAAYDVVRLTIDPGGAWLPGGLATAVQVLAACDVALPVLHGPRGEDGTLAALCELAGVPYVG